MGPGTGRGRRLTVAARAEVRQRVSDGEKYLAVAAAVGCSTPTVVKAVARTGGLTPRTRPRAVLRLSGAEREEISRGLQAAEPYRGIAARLGRAPSTVCREVAANGGGPRYRAWRADRRAERQMRRPKVAKLAGCTRLRQHGEQQHRRAAESAAGGDVGPGAQRGAARGDGDWGGRARSGTAR